MTSTSIEQRLALARSRLSLALHERDDAPALVGAPERELLAALGRRDDVGLSFAADTSAPESEPDEGAAARMLDELLERIGTRASVETRRGGHVVASTRISRAGDIVTSVAPALDDELLARHVAELERTLDERRERLLVVVAIVEMAAKIAVATGTGNPLLAVPTAIRFIRGVLAES